jgi:hypothetical protein
MVSKHYKNQRHKRENFINKHLNGDGNVIDSFIVDKGHAMGLERHDITDTGIILIYNVTSEKLVSKLIARPTQIKRYYRDSGKKPPKWLLDLCEWHKTLGYNK